MELEDEDDFPPEVQAERDLRQTSIRDWWTRLSAEYEIEDIEVKSIETLGEVTIDTCVHEWYSPKPHYDMQAFCTKCGAREQ